VSGFFGSGKSSFAKNLGYALENRTVLGSKFADLFKQQLGDTRTGDLLDLINTKTPTGVILFEVAKEADTRKVTQRIAELMYTVLLRELGYSEDFDIAELERLVTIYQQSPASATIDGDVIGRNDPNVVRLPHQLRRRSYRNAGRLNRAYVH
jgi:hypothetical protein